MSPDFVNYAMLAVLALLIFFMVRNSRKRKQQMAELRDQMVPGVEVMTNFGLFGMLVTNDTVANSAEIEISKGVIVKVHSQTLAKVVTEDEVEPGAPRSVEEAMEIANREAAEREVATDAPAEGVKAETKPEFGELSDTQASKPTESKKASE